MSPTLRTALAVEAQKLRASRIVLTAAVLLIVGISVLTGAMAAAAEAGNEQILAQLGTTGLLLDRSNNLLPVDLDVFQHAVGYPAADPHHFGQ